MNFPPTALYCSSLLLTAPHCSPLLLTAPNSSRLLPTAPYCSPLDRTAPPYCSPRLSLSIYSMKSSTIPEWEPAFLRQAREFLFFPLLPRKASSYFRQRTGSKTERLRSGFLQADLSFDSIE